MSHIHKPKRQPEPSSSPFSWLESSFTLFVHLLPVRRPYYCKINWATWQRHGMSRRLCGCHVFVKSEDSCVGVAVGSVSQKVGEAVLGPAAGYVGSRTAEGTPGGLCWGPRPKRGPGQTRALRLRTERPGDAHT